MQRVTVTLDDELVAELERYMKGRGYNNRSEAIRDLARTGMQQARSETSDNGDCIAALVYVYDHTVRELANRLAEAHHHHHDLSVAAMQVHLDHASCMEVALRCAGEQAKFIISPNMSLPNGGYGMAASWPSRSK